MSPRRALIGALAGVVVVAACELVAHGALLAMDRTLAWKVRRVKTILDEQTDRVQALLDSTATRREMIDPVLGWRYRASFAGERDTVSAQGLRSSRRYEQERTEGTVRIAAFGDSFVYGTEVANGEDWPAQLEALEPRAEVLNYGVGGYGLDQAYLRFVHEGETFAPDVILIGFVLDDLRRLVNVYRRFLDDRELPLFKPRYVMDSTGRLELLPTPFPTGESYEGLLDNPREVLRLGRQDQWYRTTVYENPLYDRSAVVRVGVTVWEHARDRYFNADRIMTGAIANPNSEAFRLQVAMFEEFRSTAMQRGSRIAILLFPDRISLERARLGEPTGYQTLADTLAARGHSFMDLGEAFLAEPATTPVARWFTKDNHYSPAGNAVVARWLARYVQNLAAETTWASGNASKRVSPLR